MWLVVRIVIDGVGGLLINMGNEDFNWKHYLSVIRGVFKTIALLNFMFRFLNYNIFSYNFKPVKNNTISKSQKIYIIKVSKPHLI